MMLPATGLAAGVMIQRMIEAGIIEAMVQFEGYLEGHTEINSNGVQGIWEELKQISETV